MAKVKTTYFCQNCGAESPKWIGKCPSCNEWNTYVEEVVAKQSKSAQPLSHILGDTGAKPQVISKVKTHKDVKLDTGNEELNRVLGGGLVNGSLVLIGGEPGIGKSTLVLQTALNIPQGKKVLYISGEESASQLKLRAERIGGNLDLCYIASETSIEKSFLHAKNIEPDLLIIDSIQTMSTERVESSAGSVAQVRECAALVLRYAKESNTPVLLIGHITKDGALAGPKVLEHIVDTVLQFEGDQNYMYRILRSVKNRFGSTSELGIFEMRQSGLREVSNPSELLLSDEEESLSGMAISATIEGARPFLIEVQALVSTAADGTPQRSTTGFDLKRLNMLLAVLEKRAGFKLGAKDVFLNIAGGIKVHDPAIDLAVLTSILSSSVDKAVARDLCMAGEVGLSGEIRPISRIEQRISEASKLGFKTIVIPQANLKSINSKLYDIHIVAASRIEKAFKYIFRGEE